jgi:glycosyltransferase involved in cell wall biosynthesis
MIYFDITKSGKARHASGLMRVNRRLREELGTRIKPVVWGKWDFSQLRPDDWYLTTEVFDVEKRKGFGAFLQNPPCRLAALFPDAIPLQHPGITWPHSVARHPQYMHALSRFDHVFAISRAVQQDLTGFWRWQGNQTSTQVSVLTLGADFDGSPRWPPREGVPRPRLLCVGIVEPRKNQTFLLDVAESLWADGLAFDLDIVGRVNPHFGAPIAERMCTMTKTRPQLNYHEAASDEKFAQLLGSARAVVFPTLAEGCGLPVIESLWRGLPCVCSDLPVLQENTADGGCVELTTNDLSAWRSGVKRILTDDTWWKELAKTAAHRPLPTWRESAEVVYETLTN